VQKQQCHLMHCSTCITAVLLVNTTACASVLSLLLQVSAVRIKIRMEMYHGHVFAVAAHTVAAASLCRSYYTPMVARRAVISYIRLSPTSTTVDTTAANITPSSLYSTSLLRWQRCSHALLLTL
jgi:hypothetical protein